MTFTPSRILVICSARIGDTLLFTPCLRALKQTFPDAWLEVWAHPKRKILLQELDFIDQLKPLSRWAAFEHRLLRKPFDIAILYGDASQWLLTAKKLATQVVAFDAQASIAVTPPALPEHAVLERLRLVQAIGADTFDRRLVYQVSAGERQWAQDWWHRHQLTCSAPVVGIQVASFPTKAYRDWPIEHFEALLYKLFEQFPQAKVLVLGDKASVSRGQRLSQIFPGVINTAGQFDLRQNAAIMARLQLYLGVDTGPTHLAGALQIPMVALYHPRHPGALLAPLQHPELTVIEHPQCGRSHAPEIPMSDIEPDRVWQAVCERLNRRV